MAAARIPHPVLFIIICLCYSLMLSIHVPHATSLSFSFNFATSGDPFTGPGAQLRREGDAKFSDYSPAHIELTKNDISRSNERSVGRVSYKQPVPLWDNVTSELSSFNTTFSFEIRPAATSNGCPVTGDGMAFFLGHYRSEIPANSRNVGGYIGLFNSYENATGDARIVAVEFDTFLNAEVDTSNNHVGIDVNSLKSMNQTDTSTPVGNLTSGTKMIAEINYDNNTETLAVTLLINGTTYRVDATVDMRRCLPEEVAVGFAAATGSCIEVHQLLSWSFNSTLDSKRTPAPAPAPQPPAHVVNPNDNKRIHRLKVALASAVPTLIVLACAVFGFRTWRQRTRNKHQRGTSESDSEEEPIELGGGLAAGPRRYPYHELADATGNFAEQEKLGRGGFGNVYRGRLPSGDMDQHQLVAVKLFSSETSSQGKKEFEAEVKIISRLRHRNLVQLLGWCDSHKGLLLVYELVELGSLDKHLYSSERLLTWPERYKIIVGLGRALQYLHADCQQCVVHGDIKPGNILLDSSYDTKLADFGLARLIEHGTRSRTTQVVAGTAGYIDPEFVNTRKPSTESDVYSFGIVLLEIVSGRPPVMEQSEKVILLLRWVWDLYGRSAVLEAVDERLTGDAGLHDRQMERALVVGLWCAHPDRSQRPSVAQAMHVLQSANAPLPALPPQVYNHAPNLEIAARAYGVLSIENPGGTFHSSTTTGTTHSSDSSATALLRSSWDLA